MKKLIIICLFSFLFLPSAFALRIAVPVDAVDDNSIIEELNAGNTEKLNIDFEMKTFESCSAFEDVMTEYIKGYWENSYKNRQIYPEMMMDDGDFAVMEMEESVAAPTAGSTNDAMAKTSIQSSGDSSGGGEDFSETNTQVLGVDESDIVKTDGKYLFYYNETERSVFIMETSKAGFFSEAKTELVKKIHLPKSFSNPQLYVTKDRLVVVASGYSQTNYSKRGYYINRNTKTYTIVFDTTDKKSPELIKLHSSDGSYRKSRRIGDYLYVLSTNYFNYPYYSIKNVDDIVIEADKFLPKQLNISKTSKKSEQNLTLKDKDLPYKVNVGNISDCSSISYSFPDKETLKNTNFNPGYNIISVINVNDSEDEVTTKVIAGSNSEIYMSLDNLYLTEGVYQPNSFSCPDGAICAMPFFRGGTSNTLVHKLNIDKKNISYQDSSLIPGSPLNQYSMDEHKGNFRIITSQWSGERSTGLYVLDENLEKISDLTNIAPGETFQSSRFIGDRLFLVTFQQIDPLFAIDLSDEKKPTILGELKIPGYSTYLHPYDDNHLIGLGYDTVVNQWGGTQNAGIKVDLYKINYDKKCGDDGLTAVQEEKCKSGDYKGIIVEQLYTETLGGKGSYSEALNNPRMFVWNKDKKVLLLPATLYERDDNYRTTDYYNGLFSLQVNKDSGIKLLSQTSHIDMDGIEELRDKECSKYSGNDAEPVCKELINGEMFCETPSSNRYVPNYCYKDSTLMQYIGDNAWKYRNMNIKRTLYIGDSVYAFSDAQLGTYNWELKEQATTSFK